MSMKLFSLALIALLAVDPARAESGERLLLDQNTDDCELFRALNGSEAVPVECRETPRSAFAPSSIAKPPKPIVLGQINFEFDSARLTEDSRTLLVKLARVLSHPVSASERYRLEGHTDMQGDPGYNLVLSKRRAGSVQDYLVRLGVPGALLRSEGYGARKLLDQEHPYDLANRRVEIVNISRGGF